MINEGGCIYIYIKKEHIESKELSSLLEVYLHAAQSIVEFFNFLDCARFVCPLQSTA